MSTLCETVSPAISTENRDLVMTRSFDDKPTVAPLAGSEGGLVLIGDPEKCRITGFPAWEVFSFDQSLFRKLESAYSDGNAAALKRLWKSAKPYKAELDT